MAGSLKASTEGLERVERARRQKGWNKAAEIWCDTALTSKATLKRFWAQQPIQQETFIRICRAVGLHSWEEIVNPNTLEEAQAHQADTAAGASQQDPNFVVCEPKKGFALPEKLPSMRNWVGRSQELQVLKARLFNSDTGTNAITAVCIVGLSGIGKTTLASQLVRQLQAENPPFVAAAWESLRSATRKPPRFDIIIDSLLLTLSNGEITAALTLQDGYLKKTEKLVKLLMDKPCLVVLDNVETVLKTGQAEAVGYFAQECAEYAWLFKRLVEMEHQSKVIFTSQESLVELPRLQTYTIYLTGLEREAAISLLHSYISSADRDCYGIATSILDEISHSVAREELDSNENCDRLTATQEELAELAARYQGHPKALQLVAALIRDDQEFQGRVGRFLRDRNWLLIRDIESLIDEGVVRLSEQERTCLRRISVYQTSEYPLSYAGIAAQMPEVSEYDLKECIILALKRRQLLEYDPERESYQLHPLVQEKAYRRLCQNPETFRTVHRQAYRYFLSIPLKA